MKGVILTVALFLPIAILLLLFFVIAIGILKFPDDPYRKD